VSIRIAIQHRIEQRFDRPVRLSTHWLRLRPAPQMRASVTAYSLAVHNRPHFLNWVRDPFENHLARLDLPEPTAGLHLELEMIAELEPINPFDFLAEPYAAEHPFAYPSQLAKELAPYLHLPRPGPRLLAWIAALDRSATTTVERLDTLNRSLRAALDALPPGRLGLVDPEAVLQRRAASYWELAWLLTLSLRHLGLAARYVCGYRVLLDESAAGQDHVSLHAWSEAYIPGAGWIALDPDAGVFCNECYLPLSAAPDPIRALPILGYVEACEETQTETLCVRRLEPAPSSWPFSDTEWRDIRALGQRVEVDLDAQQLAPSIGMTLALVSQQASAPEWNTRALGPSKRLAAAALLSRLQQRTAAGGVVQLGQGEWYAGDGSPRWRLGCYFRADGEPIWRNPARLGWQRPLHTCGREAARELAVALARRLGLAPSAVVPAYEDALHELFRVHVAREPDPAELRDPTRRRALADRLSQVRAEPAGYVLPIRPADLSNGWSSGSWVFRRERLYLLPGDSPLGYRLPLDSLPKDEDAALEASLERDPFEARDALPVFHDAAAAAAAAGNGESKRLPRTALCVEWRAGQVHVFLPPLARLEHYLSLVAALEDCAEASNIALVLEGYEPPEDHRLRRLLLEPDAGVLRLVLPETGSWSERVSQLQTAYEEADRAGLRAERVLGADGVRVSSGPGAMTLAGRTAADSPFLRRPQLLGAWIAYWQRHPCLSYLFAGRVIGPSGAAPRPDEGRDEAVYELSIALERLCELDAETPWRVDRVLRHLLTDPSGDLKRAELRTDQLYPPDRASLRLGRLTINSFETAPHERIAALQSLLVLGLIGRAARCDDGVRLARWGSALRDRFMLPDVLEADLREVLNDLNAAGYPFQSAWFEPLTALRFPRLGSLQIGAISLELRAAHEPWPLLAEEVTAGGVARFIDAANERVQVKVTGITPPRHVLCCNGQRVRLQLMAASGSWLAGVRFKAENPPATLHPTLPPVSVLVFDLIDTWTGRVIGGFSYYPARREASWSGGSTDVVARPPSAGPFAGVASLQLPAVSVPPIQGQRGRFEPHGPGAAMSAPPERHDHETPYLLDLTLET
jgi:uncharacterized protein (DUF2126 family)